MTYEDWPPPRWSGAARERRNCVSRLLSVAIAVAIPIAVAATAIAAGGIAIVNAGLDCLDHGENSGLIFLQKLGLHCLGVSPISHDVPVVKVCTTVTPLMTAETVMMPVTLSNFT